jgi:hypothetical protein
MTFWYQSSVMTYNVIRKVSRSSSMASLLGRDMPYSY